MQQEHCVIIGGSHAAAQVVSSLRLNKWEGKITIVSADAFLPYHRPPLSKSYLSGEKNLEEILIRPPTFFERSEVEVILGTRVTAIDRAAKKVHLDNQTDLPYTKLVITTGAKVRKINIPGHNLPGVFYLRDLNDVDHIREFLGHAKDAVIIGGGYIGLEAASALRSLDMNVTVLEALPRVLQRVTAPEVSAFYTRVHGEEGVRILCNASVQSIDGKYKVESVTCADGQVIKADLIIVGVGVIPDVELAEQAGLKVDNGLVVDEFARTSDPDILAAGDCTFHYNPIYDRHLRLESVQNATDQSRVAANTICGKLEPYRALPWFWSDQYDLKLQIAGLSQGFDQVVLRGSTETGRSFAAFYYKEGRLIAVDAINRPREFMACKKALAEQKTANPELVADESVDIQDAFQP
ncbi:MAG: FAD/NAD(P)-binding oxidoreductase [Porticoccaceae bacterium]|jgi:3-phenylpropionate/trans-cinnamate dioxygenase ferredoxin reductase subunit|nr:FAD/NAD(P)-binding oxidoreductase [Porticoccaceae bacterium]MEA3299048.1 FAD/NAD(P)-binding oxidoreductase [Pseudomonadota bacterium]HLS97323.1 FAD/NAD(P)-binding oxidoreductase [Porticoccaceae bacterium]